MSKSRVPQRDFLDNCERFLFFARGTLEAIRLLGLNPDVIHCNDWQAGMIPVLMREAYRDLPAFRSIGTLLTIHNLAYQGVFWHYDMPLTGLNWHLFNFHQLEFHGKLNFLKAGIVFADLLNTVSPTYAREIQTPAFGYGLEAALAERRDRLDMTSLLSLLIGRGIKIGAVPCVGPWGECDNEHDYRIYQRWFDRAQRSLACVAR